MPKKKDCDRCGFEFFKSQLTFIKGFYFCRDCLDEDIKKNDAFMAAPKIKNFNPYLRETDGPFVSGYGEYYGLHYGEGL